MSYSRRRVPLACTFCRHRKRRCDAKRPTCGNCREADAECHYDDLPTQRFDPAGSNSEILNRLQGIESLLEVHAQSMAALSMEIQARAVRPDPVVESPVSHTSVPNINAIRSSSVTNHSGGGADIPLSPWSFHDNVYHSGTAELPPLMIPAKHNTNANYLLCLPETRSLIGDYPTNLFFLLESQNSLPPELSFDGWHPPVSQVHIDRDVTDYLVTVFFSDVHPVHPILDHDTFQTIYAHFLETGIDSSVESALCLVVFALGSTALPPNDGENIVITYPGMAYMQSAIPTLMSLSAWSFEWNIILPQALVLASIYFAYIARPLHSWRLIYSASTMLQFKLARLKTQDSDPATRESLLRLFWSCFMVECDRLAELELPQSGLQQLTDETSLPSCSNLNETESTCYLAEISIRRLLNRIHNSLYPRKHSEKTSLSNGISGVDDYSVQHILSARKICDELHRQLDLWYDSIPVAFRPALGVEATANDRERVLRIRYYATRHIIYRPFVLHVTINNITQPPDSMLEKCALCLESCRLYLYNATDILKRPSQYTWTFSLSSLQSIVVLTLASLSPGLKHLVPDIFELQTLVISNIKPWVAPNSSLQTVVSIVQDIQRKQRILSCV